MNLLDYLSTKEKKNIKIKSFKTNEIIFYEDDIATSIGIILKGSVSIVSYLLDGKQIIYNSLKENEVFGNNLIFSSVPKYKGNVVSTTQSEIAFIEKDILINILQKNKEFLSAYMMIQADFAKDLNNTIKLLNIDNALERFLTYMQQNNNKIEYTSVSDLAKLLYMQRETLSRLLNNLERKRTIYRSKNVIKLYNYDE